MVLFLVLFEMSVLVVVLVLLVPTLLMVQWCYCRYNSVSVIDVNDDTALMLVLVYLVLQVLLALRALLVL